jgi:dienelactone hydrolase
MSNPSRHLAEIASTREAATAIAASPAAEAAAGAGRTAGEIALQAARDLQIEDFDAVSRLMNAEMAAGLPASALAQTWRGLTRQFGACLGLGAPKTERKADFVVARVPLEFAARTLDLSVSVAAEKIAGLFILPHEEKPPAWRPAAYVRLDAFDDAEVRIGPSGAALPGTLSLPREVAKPPVVILVHGSGPRDRDESIGPNRPFRDLAEGLATRGVAVLRYDKRTKIDPGAFTALTNPTVKDEVLDDVALAIEFVKSRPEIDADRIIVAGHSLGGALAPRIAAAHPEVARIVILAGATRPLPEITVAQVKYLAGLNGPPSLDALASIRELENNAARAAAAKPGDAGAPFLGAPLSWWADLNAYDPPAAAAGLRIPMLILQGGRDYQVTSADFERFQAALAGRADVSLRWLPSLNHLFIAGEGASTPAEYDRPGHVDAEAIELIADFALAPRGYFGEAPVCRRGSTTLAPLA